MTTLPLNVSGSATFTDDGKSGAVARVSLGPNVFAVTWHVETITVSTTYSFTTAQSQTNEPSSVAKVYRSGVMMQGTYSGDQDTSGTTFAISPNESITVEWTAQEGHIGETATVLLIGTVDTGRHHAIQ